MKRILIINIILIMLICLLPNKLQTEPTTETAEPVVESVAEPITETTPSEEPVAEKPVIEEPIAENKTLNGYRVTSYYPQENGTNNTTGSGKTTSDFSFIDIGGKKAYSYQGKIVVAAATNELLKSGYNEKGSQNKQDKHYFNYYDTGRIKINGIWYGFIVLDSCGASMWQGYYRMDIFVPNSSNALDISNVEIVYD